jgi:hypothetical protein
MSACVLMNALIFLNAYNFLLCAVLPQKWMHSPFQDGERLEVSEVCQWRYCKE